MKKGLIICIVILLCAVIAGSSAWTVHNLLAVQNAPDPNVTVVTTPEQTDFEPHPDYGTKNTSAQTDLGENLALGKNAYHDTCVGPYGAANTTDGNATTYWEGATFPSSVVVDLGEVKQIQTVRLLLNPDPIWGSRTQSIEILVSEDGENFASAIAKTDYFMTADDGNQATLSLSASGRYVQVLFHSNTGANGGQAAEIEIYG